MNSFTVFRTSSVIAAFIAVFLSGAVNAATSIWDAGSGITNDLDGDFYGTGTSPFNTTADVVTSGDGNAPAFATSLNGLSLTLIPEPSTAVLGVLSMLALPPPPPQRSDRRRFTCFPTYSAILPLADRNTSVAFRFQWASATN